MEKKNDNNLIKRLAFLPLVLLCLTAITLVFNRTAGAIVGIILALYLLLGYAFKAKHIYCFWQSTFRGGKMTPDKIEWEKIGKGYTVGFPVGLLLISVIILVFSLVKF